MIEPSLKDRLQPALIDRLTDDERVLTVIRVKPDPVQMRAHGISLQEIDQALGAHGLRRPASGSEAGDAASGAARDYLPLGKLPGIAALRSLPLRGAPGSPPLNLQACCQVDAVSALNDQLETADRRAISMRKLRAAVMRDLGLLLNASGIDDVVDLEPYPEVRRSVLNFGLRSQAGRIVSSIDPAEVARRIRDAIEFFEPRLSDVRVTPESETDAAAGMTIAFRVEAELWGQPIAQHLSLRTSIDIDSGDVVVTDQAART